MGEPVKPDLVLHLKRPWFAKVWNGEKDTEFRVKKEYWDSRIPKLGQRFFVEFRLTMRNGPRMLAQVSGVEIGKCPYPGWSGEFYCMRFEVVQHSLFQNISSTRSGTSIRIRAVHQTCLGEQQTGC